MLNISILHLDGECFTPLALVQSLHLDRECFDTPLRVFHTPTVRCPIRHFTWMESASHPLPLVQSLHLDRECFDTPLRVFHTPTVETHRHTSKILRLVTTLDSATQWSHRERCVSLPGPWCLTHVLHVLRLLVMCGHESDCVAQVSMCHGSPQRAFAAPCLNNMMFCSTCGLCRQSHNTQKIERCSLGPTSPTTHIECVPNHTPDMCFGAHFEHLWLEHQPIEYTTFGNKSCGFGNTQYKG